MLRTLAAIALAAFAFAAQAAIDVNQTSQAELETVKGIGPGLLGKILGARQAGALMDWADLVERVGGVGPGNAAKLSQAGLTVGAAAYTAPAPAEQTPKAGKNTKAAKTAKADATLVKPVSSR